MYNKPSYISDKEWLIDMLSEKLQDVPRDTISIIIQDTFMNVIKEFPNNNELEISGLGKFLFRPSAAKKQLARYEEGVEKGVYKEEVIPAIKENINYIKRRLNE